MKKEAITPEEAVKVEEKPADINPVEEKPIEEKKDDKPEAKPVANISKGRKEPERLVLTLEKPAKDAEPYDIIIENDRKKLFEGFKKSKKINAIATIAVVILLIGGLICIVQKNTTLRIVGYALALGSLLCLLVFYIFTRRAFPNDSKAYVRRVTKILNENNFSNCKFSNCTVDMAEKFNMTDINCDRVYKNTTDIGSRNIVKGFYDNKAFTVGELALYVNGDKRGTKKVCFLGKYFVLENTLKIEGRYIFTKKRLGDKQADLPSDIDDLNLLVDEPDYSVYAPKDVKKPDLPTKFISEFKSLETDDTIMNINCVIWGGHTAVYLSYDDPVISIPFDKPFNKDPQEHYKNDLEKIMKIISILNK